MENSMKAWHKALDADKSSGIRFLGDASGEFTKAWDVDFDATALLGNTRSKRYAAVLEDGKVTKVFVEPDSTGLTGKTCSYADPWA
jgi:peroxiredoxin 5